MSDIPAVGPSPVTTFKTPSGKPTALANLAISKAVSGVISEGFRTIVLPAANAGASFQTDINNG